MGAWKVERWLPGVTGLGQMAFVQPGAYQALFAEFGPDTGHRALARFAVAPCLGVEKHELLAFCLGDREAKLDCCYPGGHRPPCRR